MTEELEKGDRVTIEGVGFGVVKETPCSDLKEVIVAWMDDGKTPIRPMKGRCLVEEPVSLKRLTRGWVAQHRHPGVRVYGKPLANETSAGTR